MSLENQIAEKAREVGFDDIGFTSAQRLSKEVGERFTEFWKTIGTATWPGLRKKLSGERRLQCCGPK